MKHFLGIDREHEAITGKWVGRGEVESWVIRTWN